MPKSVSIEEEIYTHEYLWRSASMLLKHAESEESTPHYFILPALMMSFMAFEAFVNFCGFVVLPELWVEEKKHLKGKGIEGKIGKIVEKLPCFSWQKGKPPYQNIKNLEIFRDMVAHGKVIATKYAAEYKADGSHFLYKHPWDNYLSINSVNAARTDIEEFSQSLVVELRKTPDHHLHLFHDAFKGPLASASGESQIG